jgi:mannose-6-phosphate isomerase-like protein (cupin superfamily)
VPGGTSGELILVPYNETSDRYEVEIWGYPDGNLRDKLDVKGRAAFDRGELIVRTDLVHGDHSNFDRDGLNDLYMVEVDPTNSMHPILPLDVQVGWADESEQIWDAQDGANYQYEFNMILRGWENYLGVGISPNPHGGIGFLEYRNLLSNYGRYAGNNELGRQLEAYNLNAFGTKDHGNGFESFMAVDYMDLHILQPNCGIGLHRHRDNTEAFFMVDGRGYMVIGDWAKPPQRERCFEVRTLRSGHFAMLKGGNLHGLMNATDENISLFMFGGYD